MSTGLRSREWINVQCWCGRDWSPIPGEPLRCMQGHFATVYESEAPVSTDVDLSNLVALREAWTGHAGTCACGHACGPGDPHAVIAALLEELGSARAQIAMLKREHKAAVAEVRTNLAGIETQLRSIRERASQSLDFVASL